jgi:hypothetical protein
MKLLPSKREKILTVVDRWLEIYSASLPKSKDKQTIYRQLQELDKETCSAKSVTLIIGNSSLIDKPACSECDKRTYNLVQLGETPDYESNTAYLCKACLVKALSLFETTKE